MSNFKPVINFWFWCQKVLPLVYDDSISYYEVLCKMSEYLNQVINNVNALPDLIDDKIKEYISSGEIENVLNEMLQNYFPIDVKNPPADLSAAVGDGSVDDTATLQNIINYAAEHNLPMIFPAGIYRVSSLTIAEEAHFLGVGNPTIFKLNNTEDGLINVEGSFTAFGMTFNANIAGVVNPVDAITGTCDNISLSNCSVTGCVSCIDATVSDILQIVNCHFSNYTDYGVYAQGTGRILADGIIVDNVANSGAMRFVRIDSSNGIVKNLFSMAEVPVGVEITGDFNTVDGRLPNCENPVNDGGQNNSYNFFNQIEKVCHQNSTENIASKKEIVTDDLILRPTNPLTYKQPESFSNAFNSVPAKDYFGNPYNILTAQPGAHLPPTNVISAKDFGAIGDGVTDDYNALQSFFNYIVPNGLFGFIPNGTYLSSNTLGYRKEGSVNLIGESRDGVIIKRAEGSTTSALDFRNCKVNYIGNLTIDCSGTPTQAGGHGLNLVDVNPEITDSGVIENITIINVAYSAIQAYCSSASTSDFIYNLTFRNINMQGLGVGYNSDGVHPSGLIFENANGCHIQNSLANNFDHYPFEFKDFSRYSTIDSCVVMNCGQGFFLGGDSSAIQNYYCRFIQMNNVMAINCAHGMYCGTAQAITINNYICYPGSNTVDEINLNNSQDVMISNPILILQEGVTGIVIQTGRRISIVNANIDDVSSELNSQTFNATGDVRNVSVVIGTTTKTALDNTGLSGVNGYSLAVLPLAKWYGTNQWE